MRKHSIALVAAFALGTLGSILAQAQTTNPPRPKRIFGFQDSRTGSFHPLGHSPDLSDAASTTTTYSGTIEVTVTITLKTALPKGDVVGCSVSAVASSEDDVNPLAGVSYEEDAASTATVSGSTATCKVNIPYSWVLLTPSTTKPPTIVNTLDGSLDVYMYSPTSTTITTDLEDFVREHSQAITINGGVPGDGTETVSVAVTI